MNNLATSYYKPQLVNFKFSKFLILGILFFLFSCEENIPPSTYTGYNLSESIQIRTLTHYDVVSKQLLMDEIEQFNQIPRKSSSSNGEETLKQISDFYKVDTSIAKEVTWNGKVAYTFQLVPRNGNVYMEQVFNIVYPVKADGTLDQTNSVITLYKLTPQQQLERKNGEELTGSLDAVYFDTGRKLTTHSDPCEGVSDAMCEGAGHIESFRVPVDPELAPEFGEYVYVCECVLDLVSVTSPLEPANPSLTPPGSGGGGGGGLPPVFGIPDFPSPPNPGDGGGGGITTPPGGGGGGGGSIPPGDGGGSGGNPDKGEPIDSINDGGGSATTPVLLHPLDPGCKTSVEDLQTTFPNARNSVLQKIANYINEYGADFGINTAAELQQFLAQAAFESKGITSGKPFDEFKENFNIRVAKLGVSIWRNRFNPLGHNDENPNERNASDFVRLSNPLFVDEEKYANYVYNDEYRDIRHKLGNIYPGDGYKYRGRGIFQLTGRFNYNEFNNFYQENYDSSVNLIDNPNLVASDMKIAVISALWYFHKKVMSKINIDDNTSCKKVTYLVNGGYNGLKGRKAFFDICKTEINCN